MALTEAQIRAAKPREKDWKLADERGLYLLVTPKGAKLWRYKFRFLGTERKLSFGSYPDISLKEARQLRDKAKCKLVDGIDPARERQVAKITARLGAENRFEAIAEEFIDKREKEGLAETTITKARWFLALLRPRIGKLPISDITPQELLAALKKVEGEGHRETAKRLRSFASRVFRYAVATGRATADPAQPLRGALIAPLARHYAAITDPSQLGELLRAIDGYRGEPVTIAALRLTPHVYQRPGEVRQMHWSEVDFDRAIWAIPAERMKQRRPHAVPLSRQAIVILRDIQALTGRGRYVFPSVRSRDRAMSENTINGALRRLGYTGSEMTAHGFRSTASSLLNESNLWSPDAIERALSHADANQVRRTYNHSPYWAERVEMAQWWSDYLDSLRTGEQAVPIVSPSQARLVSRH